MTEISSQPASRVYQLVKIPLSQQVSCDVKAGSIEEVRAWALQNVDTTRRWIIKLDGRNLGEGVVVDRYTFDTDRQKVVKRTFNSTARRSLHFDTPEEALADYRSHLEEASRRLDVIVQRVSDLQRELAFSIGDIMLGDTHGIEDYPYVSVTVGGYAFRRAL